VVNDSNGEFILDQNKAPVAIDDDPFARVVDYYIRQYKLTMTISTGNSSIAVSRFYSGNRPCPVVVPAIAYNAITVGNFHLGRDSIDPSSCQGPTTVREDRSSAERFKPDVAAPGNRSPALLAITPESGIVSANAHWDGLLQPDYKPMIGTSMAAPHVAGAAALLRGAGVTDPLAIKALLINTTDQFGWHSDIGWGFINLWRTWEWLNYFTNTADGPTYFAGASDLFDEFCATLVWNRRSIPKIRDSGYDTTFTDLDLYLYDADANAVIGSFATSQQNVEQIYLGEMPASAAVLKVNRYAGLPEPFALAVSAPNLHPVQPPRLSATCTAPSASLAAFSALTVDCTLTNPGELDLFDLHSDFLIPSQMNSPVTSAPYRTRLSTSGDYLRYRFSLSAPSTPGTYAVLPVFRADAYDENYIWWSFNRINVGSSAGLTIQSLTAANATITPSRNASITVTLSGSAPTGGMTIANTIDAGAMILPFALTIPAGQRSAAFVVSADFGTISGPYQARLTSTLFGSSQSLTLAVLP
jgi:hypothetical protein